MAVAKYNIGDRLQTIKRNEDIGYVIISAITIQESQFWYEFSFVCTKDPTKSRTSIGVFPESYLDKKMEKYP